MALAALQMQRVLPGTCTKPSSGKAELVGSHNAQKAHVSLFFFHFFPPPVPSPVAFKKRPGAKEISKSVEWV